MISQDPIRFEVALNQLRRLEKGEVATEKDGVLNFDCAEQLTREDEGIFQEYTNRPFYNNESNNKDDNKDDNKNDTENDTKKAIEENIKKFLSTLDYKEAENTLSTVDLDYINEYEFIEMMLGLPYHEMIVRSLDMDVLAKAFLKRKNFLLEDPKKYYEIEIQDFNDIIEFFKSVGLKDYLLTLLDYEVVEIARKVLGRFGILFADVFILGLVNFLLKEFLLSLIENGKDLFGNSFEKEKEILENKKYPIFLVNKEGAYYKSFWDFWQKLKESQKNDEKL